jgi:hypothetical protein
METNQKCEGDEKMQDRKSVPKPEWREKWKQLLERKTERTKKFKKKSTMVKNKNKFKL